MTRNMNSKSKALNAMKENKKIPTPTKSLAKKFHKDTVTSTRMDSAYCK